MEEKNDEIDRQRIRSLILINQISSLIAFIPPLFAFFAGLRLIDWAVITGVQIVVLLVLSVFKYRADSRGRKVEESFPQYILGNTFSYALISVAIPTFLFLIDFFYSLHPVVRIAILNVLFILALLILLSNLPASRLKRIAKPLEDHYLIDKASELAARLGTGELEIYILNLGKFKIANAGQVGARKYSVFISDYLLENLSQEENVAVIAHEFAHAKRRHVFKNVIQAWLLTTVAMNLIALPVDLGIRPFSTLLLPAIGLLILGAGSMLLIPAIRRRYEIEADLIATDIFDGNILIRALEKITELNRHFGESPKYWSMDHPTTKDRARRIREYIKRKQ